MGRNRRDVRVGPRRGVKRTGADRFTDDGLPVEPCDCADAFEDVLARPPCCLCWLGRSFAAARTWSSASLGRCSMVERTGEPGEVVEGAAPLRRLVRRPREEIDGPRVAHEEKHIAGGAARRLNRSKAAVSCPATTAETSARASLDGSAGLAASFGSPHWSSRPSGVTRKNRIFGLAVADAVAPNRSLVSSPPALGGAGARRLLLGQADAPSLAHAAAYDAADPPRVGRKRTRIRGYP